MHRLYFLVRPTHAAGPLGSPAPLSLLVMTFESAVDALLFALAAMEMQMGGLTEETGIQENL